MHMYISIYTYIDLYMEYVRKTDLAKKAPFYRPHLKRAVLFVKSLCHESRMSPDVSFLIRAVEEP